MTASGTDRGAFGADPSTLRRRTGSLQQLARVEQLVHADGPARGSRLIRMLSAGGLDVDVHPDRALDLGLARYRGIPISWLSSVGMAAPGLADDQGTRWLRTFGGGLLATCGLDSFGPPSVDAGREFGLHGRVGHLPASVHTAGIVDGVLTVAGTVRQAAALGDDLVLERVLRMPLDGGRLELHDRVTNEGFDPAGHMVLYHMNFGWPLLDDTTSVSVTARRTLPLNAAARAAPEAWRAGEPPRAGAEEQVYLHDMTAGPRASATMANPVLGLRVAVGFDTATLPALMQWRLPGEGRYVMGLEPANTPHLGGRASARERGLLPVLAPGQSVDYRITVAIESEPRP